MLKFSCDTPSVFRSFINLLVLFAEPMMLDVMTPETLKDMAANILRSKVQNFSEFRGLARQVGMAYLFTTLHWLAMEVPCSAKMSCFPCRLYSRQCQARKTLQHGVSRQRHCLILFLGLVPIVWVSMSPWGATVDQAKPSGQTLFSDMLCILLVAAAQHLL